MFLVWDDGETLPYQGTTEGHTAIIEDALKEYVVKHYGKEHRRKGR